MEGLEWDWQRLPGLADPHLLKISEEVKELKRGGRVRHVNKNKHLVELGEYIYIDENQMELVWRSGPAPEIQILFLH